MSDYSPATSSLWEAYTAPIVPWIDDSKKLVRSGVETNFTLEKPPSPYRSTAAEVHEASFANRYSSLYLKVYKVDVVEDYQSPRQEPYVEHLMVQPPAEAVQGWSSRLRPVGGMNTLQVIIRDAHVVATPLPPQDPEAKEINRRYDARLEVEMRICSREGVMKASVSTVAMQSIILGEKTDIDTRRLVFHRLLTNLMDSVNSDLEHKMLQNFTPYIDYTKTAWNDDSLMRSLFLVRQS